MKLNSGVLPMSDEIISATARLLSNGKVLTDYEHYKTLKGIKMDWIE
jgi:hypothetical protein